jgi:hypothetical protein
VLHAQDFARGGELLTSQLAQVLVRLGAHPVGRGLPVRETEYRHFMARLDGQHQGSAKGEAFIVRMCGNAKESAGYGFGHGQNQGIANLEAARKLMSSPLDRGKLAN